jgi:hypothetical protein
MDNSLPTLIHPDQVTHAGTKAKTQYKRQKERIEKRGEIRGIYIP